MKKKLFIAGGILAFLVLIMVIFTLTLGNPPKTDEPKASLEVQKGSVEINGRLIKVGVDLKQGDEVKTGENSLAIINFFDKSTSRIDSNSTIKIDRLSSSNEGAKTEVGIKVTLGNVWSRIVKLVDKESKLEVETPTTVATVRGTAFNVEVGSDGREKISVTENVVSAKIKDLSGRNKILAATKLIQGDKVELDNKNIPKDPLALIVAIKEIDEADLKSSWIEKNKEKDKSFEDTVKKKEGELIKEKAGITSDSSLYFLKETAQKIRLAATFGNESKAQFQIKLANQKLAEAGKLLGEGKQEIAKKAMEEYGKGLEKALSNLDELKNQGNQNAYEKISQKIQEQIVSQKNTVANALPDSPLYEIKQKIEEAQLMAAGEGEGKVITQLEQAKERLKEAKKLMEENKGDIATKTLKNYGKALEEARKQAGEMSQKQGVEVLNKIIEQTSGKTIENQLFLKAMEQSAPPEIKEKILEQKIKGMEEAKQIMKKNPEKFKEFQKDIIRNGTSEIPKEFIDKGFIPDWVKEMNQQREQIMKDIISKLPVGTTLPQRFVIPDFGIAVKPGETLDYSKFIPLEFQGLPLPPKPEDIVKPLEGYTTTPPPEVLTAPPPEYSKPPEGETTTLPLQPSTDPNKIIQIVIGPSSASIKSGGVMFFKAFAIYGDGRKEDISASAVWSVNYDTGTGVIDPGGRFIAGGIGTCTISATFNGITGTSGVINITPM